jgi:4a-hydroxytetrahydrobiopterin dehydratase
MRHVLAYHVQYADRLDEIKEGSHFLTILRLPGRSTMTEPGAQSAGLATKRCVPCEGGTQPLSRTEIETYLSQVGGGWKVEGEKTLTKQFTFRDFVAAMKFVSSVADIAEAEGHHPDIHISYNKVRFDLWTHAIGGLSENDFILAAKIEQAASR